LLGLAAVDCGWLARVGVLNLQAVTEQENATREQALAREPKRHLAPVWRAVIEVGFIVFLFYSNLLMGEFSRANGHGKTFARAIVNIFTPVNFGIAVASGLMGYVVVEYLRKKI
jgi:hypothetical protein